MVTVLTLAATILRSRIVGWTAAAAAVVGIVLTFFTLKSMTEVAARDPKAAAFGTTWNNLGAGGFTACIAFGLFAAAAVHVVSRVRPAARSAAAIVLPVTKAKEQVRGSANAKALLAVAVVLALFYPPTLSLHWQTVLVSEVERLPAARRGPERRCRLGRAAGPRVHRVLRGRCVHHGVLHGLPAAAAAELAAYDAAARDPVRDRGLPDRRRPARRADAAAAR